MIDNEMSKSLLGQTLSCARKEITPQAKTFPQKADDGKICAKLVPLLLLKSAHLLLHERQQ
jgi:hypothetical protein